MSPLTSINNPLVLELKTVLARIIAETNGITLNKTVQLLLADQDADYSPEARAAIESFHVLLADFEIGKTTIDALLEHPFAKALGQYFLAFQIPFQEHHTHLTGALTEDFVFPRLQTALQGPHKEQIAKQIQDVFGVDAATLKTPQDLTPLMRLQTGQAFVEYLRVIFLTKLVLTTKEAHKDAAYHMAKTMHETANIGMINLKWAFSRSNTTGDAAEEIPGIQDLTSEDVTLGLYEGFAQYQQEHPEFDFVLSPSFRKEADYFDNSRFATKAEDITSQVQQILDLREQHPELQKHLIAIDTVGNEFDFYSKEGFLELKDAFRKLQFYGFQIRSHHGETWRTLRRGIQAVDNALNIWAVDAIEHGVALGVNPNDYFHRLFQQVVHQNIQGQAIDEDSQMGREIADMDFRTHTTVRDKLFAGGVLNETEIRQFTKTKFHTSREVERYQHDVLNRIIDTNVELVSLPSSNYKLTSQFSDYKEHPFSWWEKKGMKLRIGTDNFVTLDSTFIREMLILLCTDPKNLKITKLLMVATGEKRRPYMSNILWQMNKSAAE